VVKNIALALDLDTYLFIFYVGSVSVKIEYDFRIPAPGIILCNLQCSRKIGQNLVRVVIGSLIVGYDDFNQIRIHNRYPGGGSKDRWAQ